MKKVLYCLILLIFSNICIYAASSEKVAVFNVGITSGIPFYGDDSILASNDVVNGGEINRVLVGLSADVSFNLAIPIKLIAGSDLLADFIWGGSSYSNHLDYSFFCGIKVYPNLFGFNTSIAYLLGSRTDFINNDMEDSISSTAWGNGFRISVGYDFAYGRKNVFAPALGVYYRCIPRGSDFWDNVLAAYISFSF